VRLYIYGDDWNLDNIECNVSLPGIAGAVNYKCQIKKERTFDMSNQVLGLVIEGKATCTECKRVFNLYDLEDAEEYFYGHDCEVDE
jgi:hypothetical protein